MAKSKEPWGATTASIIAAAFSILVEKLLPLEQFADEFSNILRVYFVVMMVIFAWKAWRYYETLGGADEPHGSWARDDYDSLRQELTEGGRPAKVYANWLKLALHQIDKFFGDAGRHDRSWFARKLGLETPGPRWTAPAFDKCLLLALVYPIVTILIVWSWSGQVGVVEEALGLQPIRGAYAGLWRGMFGLGLVIQIYAFWRAARAEGLTPTLLWLAFAFVGLVAGSGAVAVAFADAGLSAAAFAVAGTSAGGLAAVAVFTGARNSAVTGAGAGVHAVTLAITIAFAVAFTGAFTFAFAVGGLGAGAGAGLVAVAVGGLVAVVFAVAMISERSTQKGRQGVFLSLFVPTLLLAAFVGAHVFSTLEGWDRLGVFLMVFGVLTLVNAPFDWVAIGLTRALLRRGLAPGGPGPYFCALIDAIVAVPLIMLLAFVTIVAVQTFDDIAVLRAGPQVRILPLGPLFEGLEDNPSDPKFWWVWLMLFSTLIPSLFNLVIGAAAFLRGLPFMNNWILSRMPIGKAMRDSERVLVASALAGQLVGGMLISGVLLYLLAEYVVPLGLPTLGAYIRDFSEKLAAYNAPARLMMWVAGSR